MVRRDINDYVHANARAKNRGYSAGLPVLENQPLSAEREVCLDARRIRSIDACCFGQPPFTFGAFRRQQMPS